MKRSETKSSKSFQTKALFDISARSVLKFMPLLKSEDEGLQLQVLSHLSKLTREDVALCNSLVSDHQIITTLLRTFVFRSDAKPNLSLLSVKILRNVRRNVGCARTKSSIWKSCVKYCAANILQPGNTIHNSLALLSSELTQEKRYSIEFVQKVPDLNLLINNGLASSDPDVQDWSLQIIRNILLAELEQGSFEPTMVNVASLQNFYQSDYPATALVSLDVTRLLLCSSHGEKFQQHFTQSGGFQGLMDILNSTNLQDIHNAVFDVLSCLMKFPAISPLITETVVRSLMTYAETFPDNELSARGLGLLVDIAVNVKDATSILAKLNIASQILKCIHDEYSVVIGHGCSLVSHLLQDDSIFASIQAEDKQVLSVLCCIIHERGRSYPWDVRVNAAQTLYTMMRYDRTMCDKFVTNCHEVELMRYLEEAVSDETPAEMISAVLSILFSLYSQDEYLYSLPYQDFYNLMKSLIFQLQSQNSEIRFKSAVLFSSCIRHRNDLAFHFLINEHPKVMIAILHGLFVNAGPGSEAEGIYGQLIRDLMASHSSYVDAVISDGMLHFLIQEAELQPLRPAWKQMLKDIFQHSLSAKFAYTNKLESWDRISPGFYFSRNGLECEEKFPTLEELTELLDLDCAKVFYLLTRQSVVSSLKFRCTYEMQSLPVCMSQIQNIDENDITSTISTYQLNMDINKTSSPGSCPIFLSSDASPDEWKKTKESLSDYNIETLFQSDVKSRSNVSDMRSLAELLADRVLTKLPMKIPCTQEILNACQHHFHLHLCELMRQNNAPIILFEDLQRGQELECSVLFKLFCDHMAIPCSLHRGSNAREVWTQVHFSDNDDAFTIKFSNDSVEII